MAVMGALDSGLKNDHTVLLAKSIIDGTAAIAFAGSLGIGVAFSGASVLLVEGLLALLAFVCFRCENSCHMLARFTCGRKTRIVTAIFFCIALVHLSRESVFIYFNF